MAEPQLYEIMDHEAKLLAEKVNPRRVLLNMDEVRMGGTCRACQGKDMAKLLGETHHSPDSNAAQITFQGSRFMSGRTCSIRITTHTGIITWFRVIIPVPGNTFRRILLSRFGAAQPVRKASSSFAAKGFQTLVACYYDADDLSEVKGWIQLG